MTHDAGRESPQATTAAGRNRESDRGLRVSGLSKSFAGTKATTELAIDDVSFEVPEGSFVTLVGPSGCGKTTSLRCIAGLEQADQGEITISGTTVFSSPDKLNLRTEDRPIAFVPQSYGIWPHMTVFQNAAFPLVHGRHRQKRGQSKKRVMEMLEKVGLQDYSSRWGTQLSGGQQQRLALARALLCDPDLILLDEPLSNLDAKLRVQLRSELKAFQRDSGVTTLYVTHDQSEAFAISDTIVVMRKGRVEQMGSPRDIYESPKTTYVADFMGSANLIPGGVDLSSRRNGGVDVQTAFGLVRCGRVPDDLDLDVSTSGSGTVCVRPEHVRIDLSEAKINDSDLNTFEGTLVSVEFVGERQEVIVELNNVTIRAYAPPEAGFRPGDPVVVKIDPAKTLCLSQ